MWIASRSETILQTRHGPQWAKGPALDSRRVTIEQIRFITPQLATIDGSWMVTGARGPVSNARLRPKGRVCSAGHRNRRRERTTRYQV
jgi:hypothetical protein